MTRDHQSKAWSDVAAERKATGYTGLLLPMHELLLDATRAAGDVLDAGCGSGELSGLAIRRGCRTTGLDLAPSMIELCRADPTLAEGTFVEGDLQRMPFPSDSFDVVIASMSAHFCDDPLQALRELWRVVRPGGRVAVSTPASPAVEAVLVFHIAKELLPEEAADVTRPLLFSPEGVLAGHLRDIGCASIEERVAQIWLTGDTFDDLFAKQHTWAPVRRAVEKVGLAAFMAAYQPRLVELVGTPEPTRLDMSFKVVSGTKQID